MTTIQELLDEVDETYGVIVTDYDLIDKELKEHGLTRHHTLDQVHILTGNDGYALIEILDGAGLVITDDEDLGKYFGKDEHEADGENVYPSGHPNAGEIA